MDGEAVRDPPFCLRGYARGYLRDTPAPDEGGAT